MRRILERHVRVESVRGIEYSWIHRFLTQRWLPVFEDLETEMFEMTQADWYSIRVFACHP